MAMRFLKFICSFSFVGPSLFGSQTIIYYISNRWACACVLHTGVIICVCARVHLTDVYWNNKKKLPAFVVAVICSDSVLSRTKTN